MEKGTLRLCGAAIGALLFLFAGCGTTRGIDKDIINHQREIDRLEDTVRMYDAAVGRAVTRLGSLQERSLTMAGEVGEIISLFDEYQRAVDQLLRDYNEIRSALTAHDYSIDYFN